MELRKRGISLLLAMAMLIGSVPMPAFATEEVTEELFEEVLVEEVFEEEVSEEILEEEVFEEEVFEEILVEEVFEEELTPEETETQPVEEVFEEAQSASASDACEHSYENGICTGCGDVAAMAGKKLSVLGASISTYTGISNNAGYNSTIGSNAVYYTEGRYGVYANDTWWMQAANDLGLELLVNNAWSGSSLLYERNGTVGAYVDRCVQLHNNEGENPDIIAIQMGTNDFQYYKDTLGTADIDYAALIVENEDGSYAYAEPTTSLEAAAIVLHKISVRYPNAEVYYLNISQRVDGTDALIQSFNAELKQVVEHFGAHIVDIYGSAITMEKFDTYIGDGRVHPNALGMDAYTEAFKRSVIANTNYQIDTHTVSLDLEDVTADYGDDKIVVSGDAFRVELTAADSLSVTVTMDTEDITASVYAGGSVSIPAVTADVTITATSVHEPQNYRWEFDGTDLACVNGGNTLTKNGGTTTDGVFTNTKYALETAVVLKHDLPWTVEWKCEGTFQNSGNSSGARIFTSTDVNSEYNARYIFKSNKNGLIAMGEKTTSGSHNYGIALGDRDIDWTAEHTYLLENRIADDGSNMVYLWVDGVEIGAMNHYYVGTTDKNTTSDWLCGKDFVFPYMGTDTHGFTNASIEYISVAEEHTHTYTPAVTAPTCTEQGYTTYTCACGDSYVADFVDAGHTFENGLCTLCGVTDLASFEYTLNEDSTVTLTKYTGSNATVAVADSYTVGGRNYATVLDCSTVFTGNKTITSVTVGSGVGFKDDSMAFLFYQCHKLASVDMTGVDTSRVTTMESLFDECKKLTVIDGYGEWDTGSLASMFHTFDQTNSLTTVDLSKWDLSKVENTGWCFQQCYATEIKLPDNLKTISAGFLNHASKVTGSSFTIPAGVEKIGYAHTIYDFATNDFVEFTVAEGNSHYVALDGILYSADGTEMLAVPRNKTFENNTYEIPEGVTFLGELSFSRNYNIHTLVLPDSFVIEYVPLNDARYIVFEDIGNINAGTNLSIAIYCYTGITEYAVKDSNPNYTSLNGIIYSKDMTEVVAIPARYAQEIVIPEGVTAWNMEAMWADTDNNSSSTLIGLLKSCPGVTIPASLKEISENQLAMLNLLYTSRKDTTNPFTITVAQGNTAFELDENEGLVVKVHEHSYENGVCTICGAEEPAEPMSLRYDDHVDMTGKTVEIVNAGTPTSYQVGYGVEENTVLDTAVVTMDGDALVATGIGTAKVCIDGTLYEITVEAAPISLLLLIGQSNMQGSEGNANQSIVCPDGMVYSTYGDRYTMTISNATNFAPSALTGEGSALNVNGTTANLEDWPVYLLNEAGAGKAGPDSGYAYEWVKQTGEKVWIVNAAHGGTSINVWQDGGTQYEECVALFKACQETLRKEISAGHFTLSHTGYFWCQGCSDETQTAQWYANKYLSMHESLNTELAADLDGDGNTDELEFANITVTLAGHVSKTGYRYEDGLYDSSDSTFFMTYEELEMRGQRVAQYWLAANPDYPEINMVCNIGENWVTMPDGTDGVADYFKSHYENGTVDYETQVQQSASWYTPATPKAVKDSIHYNQIGYNEVGREAARNTLVLLGEIVDSNEETTVRFVDWTGYREVSSANAAVDANASTLIVPVVYPCYRAKDVSYSVSDGLSYEYFDLLASSEEITGVLNAVGAAGTVTVEQGHCWSEWEAVAEPSVSGPGLDRRTCSKCGEEETRTVEGVWQTLKLSDHMAEIPEYYCAGTNLWTAMERDPYFFTGSYWKVHASGTVYSVTIPLEAGDKIYATAFGAAGENGGNSNGIRLTFFNAEGVAKTYAPADTYAAFVANGGYLIAPEGTVAANIVMWTNRDDNELYILNREHTYENGICTLCGGSVLDGGYTAAVPENQGVQNAIDRAYALTDVEWTPVADVPGVQKIDGVYTVITFEAGKTYKGIPYSGVTANDCYVGLNVSLESYLTALENENSVLYTENLNSTNKKAATYYGTVCSKFVQYALDVPGSYNTNNVANIPGMQTVALPGEYTVDQIRLGDVVVNTATHTTICTGILCDADGNVAFIEISEAVSPLCRRLYWSVEEFYEHFADYRLCRYDYIGETPAAQEPQVADSYALMPRFGDKYNYKTSSAKGVVDVLESGYSKAVILRDGVVIDEIALNGAASFKFDRSVPGYLEMYLEKDDGTRSGSVYACVVKSSVTVEDATEFALGKLTVTVDGSCGTPLYVQVGSAHAIFCDLEGQDGTVELTFPASKISTQQVRVACQNEYGIYLSSWVSFTAEENPSKDPLLSRAKYWNGYNITPSSPTPVIQSNKVGYWSYTMIPVAENTTYYSEGATRLWYLDAKGDPISTYNAYKDGDVPFRFTTPAGTAYVNIAYSPNLVEQGTETLVHVHTYEKGTCIECGHWNGPVIVRQPVSVQASIGEKFSVTVEAEGEGLSYRWYYRGGSSGSFAPSSFRGKSYAMTMQSFCHNREIYCVITDANGNSVQSDTVTLTVPLTITRQPVSVQAKVGSRFSVSVQAIGDGLTYQWYYKNSGGSAFAPSSFRGREYALTMASYCHNRQLYCVVTDAYGNSVRSDTVTVTCPPVALKILGQPSDVYASRGNRFSIHVKAQGEGLRYQWYYKESYMKNFSRSSNTSSTYAYTMTDYRNGRQVYCVITDKYGNQVTSAIATIHLVK